MRRWKWVGLVALAVVIAVVAIAVSMGGTARSRDLIVTATAARRTLDDKVTLTGQLSRVEQRKVVASAAAQISAVHVKDGDVVQPGQPIVAINGRDAVAETGLFPFFRTLDVGATGEDVRQLDQILATAGYSPGPIGTVYTDQTRFALAQWQAAHGYPGAAPNKRQTVTVSLSPSGGYKVGPQSTAAVVIGPAASGTPSASPTATAGPAHVGALVPYQPGALRGELVSASSGLDAASGDPVLTIAALNEVTTKGTPATFVVYSSAASATPLELQIATGGTAGPDEVLPPAGPFVLPAGADSVQIPVPTRLNGLVEANQTVTMSLQPGSGYSVGSPSDASTVVVSNDVPKISVTGGGAVSPGQPATIVFTADQAPVADTEIDLSVGGDAVPAKDYQPVGSSVVLPAGHTQAAVTISTLSSGVIQPDRHIVVTVVPGASYTPGPTRTATVTVLGASGAQAQPVVSIESSVRSLTKGQPLPVTIVLDHPMTTALTVHLGYGGTALNGTDYLPPADPPVVAAGQTSAVIQVPTVVDQAVQSDRSLVVSLVTSAAYRIGSPSEVTATIVSGNLPVLTISAGSTAVAAGAATTFRITADQPPVKDTSVNFQVVGTAVAGQDFEPLTGTAILAAGQQSVDVPLSTIDRNVVFDPTDMIVDNWPIRVGQVLVKAGDVVQPAAPVLSLTDTAFTVTLSASPSDRTRLNVGQSVTVKLTGGTAQASGVISQLDDNVSVDATTKQQTYKGKISVGDLGAADGAAVTIDVVLQEKKDVLTVPIASVLQNGVGKDVVRVIDLAHGGHVTEAQVTTGLAVDSYIEIDSGLKENDVIIVETDRTKG